MGGGAAGTCGAGILLCSNALAGVASLSSDFVWLVEASQIVDFVVGAKED